MVFILFLSTESRLSDPSEDAPLRATTPGILEVKGKSVGTHWCADYRLSVWIGECSFATHSRKHGKLVEAYGMDVGANGLT